MFLTKLAFLINQAGFAAFMFLFGIALYVGKFLYKVVLTPVLWVLWQCAKLMPEDKADPNPSALEKMENAFARGVCGVMDGVIFKTKELVCEKWLKEHPEFK
jgi:hypothetical protein